MIVTDKQHRGVFSLDLLASVLPLVLILAITINTSYQLADGANEGLKEQQLFNKLVSVADFVVKNAGAKIENETIKPNLIDEERLKDIDEGDLEEKLEIKNLYIGFENKDRYCIYRIVLYEGEIRKLFICGEYENH